MLNAKKTALIHAVKNELRMTGDEYRTLLKAETGVESSKDLTGKGSAA